LSSTSKELNLAIDVIEKLINLLETSKEPLSEFEKGQEDGLRWALDVVRDIKSPEGEKI
jgi:hypothetical protein